jgi:hypothetical protein
MSDALEDLKAQYNSISDDDIEEAVYGEVENDAPDDALGDDEVDSELDDSEDDSEDSPPGFKSYDEWVESGKNPEDYKGKNAYKAEYERIQEVKELKTELKGMNSTLQDTVKAISQREEASEVRHRKELEAALAQAKEDGDTDAALDAQEQLHSLRPEQVAPQAPRENPIISTFIGNNSALESEDIKGEFARIYNGKLRADGVRPEDQLSESAINGYLKSAMDGVKSLYPDKFKSQRADRASVPRTKKKPVKPKQDVERGLKNLKISGLEGRNENAAIGIYNTIKRNSGEEAANRFAKKMGIEI